MKNSIQNQPDCIKGSIKNTINKAVNGSILQDFQLLDNTLTFIDVGVYSTVEEAIECGAAYVSDDITALDSYMNGYKTALYDLQDALCVYSKCLGHRNIKAFLRASEGFVCIDDLT